MNSVVTVILTLLGKVVPAIGSNAGLIADIITALEAIVPVVIQEYKDLLPEVKNVIAALKGTDGISQAQWDALDSLEADVDTEFNEAATEEGL